MYISLIIISVVVIFLFSMVGMVVKRYKRCPSDSLLVIYGRTGKNKTGEISTAKILHGGGAFVWPVVQDYKFLDLKPMALNIPLKNALSKQNIRVDVPSVFSVAISTEDGVMINAAERLLGMTSAQIGELASDIIFGQLRLVIATMDIEEINSNRDAFYKEIQTAVEPELAKIGLKLVNVNITDISDESGYIKALGKEAAATAINEARKSVAEKDRDGEIGVANAQKDQRIETSKAESDAQAGEAQADKEKRIKVAEAQSKSEIGEAESLERKRIGSAAANARAIEGENISKVNVAKTTAGKEIKEAEFSKNSEIAKKVNAAEALETSYEAEKKAELKRALMEESKQQASIIVPAKIAKEKLEIEAEAIAEKTRRIAQGEADAIFAKMEAEARGNEEILVRRAEGFEKLVKAAGSAENAIQMMVTDELANLVEIQASAISNIRFDSIKVWDTGGSNGDSSSTADFTKNILKSLPPFGDIFKMAGTEMPAFLQGNTIKELAKVKADSVRDRISKKED